MNSFFKIDAMKTETAQFSCSVKKRKTLNDKTKWKQVCIFLKMKNGYSNVKIFRATHLIEYGMWRLSLLTQLPN